MSHHFLVRNFPIVCQQARNKALPTPLIGKSVEEGGAGIPFKGPLKPAALSPIVLFRAIQLHNLVFHEVSEGPVLLMGA
jgi:hypothetical protein